MRRTHAQQQKEAASLSLEYIIRVHPGHGKPGKSWNFIISFSKATKVMENHGKLCLLKSTK